jgi:hypothetical protein
VTEPQRFFFVHLQKTAGTALWRRLRAQFPPEAVYPGPDDGAPPDTVLSVAHLRERWARRRDEIRIVTGHFPLCTVELLGAPFVTLTVLREPVERTLSYLRHHRATTPADAERPLEEIYEDPIRFQLLHDHMVKMLSLSTDEMTDGALTPVTFDAERSARARAAVDTMDVVGFQEDFDAFCRELEERFGWDLGDPVFMNRTEAVEVTPAFRARIASDNAADVELYEYARSARWRTGG